MYAIFSAAKSEMSSWNFLKRDMDAESESV
jgi:hypothetical protein